MALTLILTRHAKSSWGDLSLDDFDRPLNARGRRDAPRIGQLLRDRGTVPTSAICSPAARTRETFTRMGFDILASFPHRLYLGSPDALALEIRASRATGPLLLIAHNPGIAMLAQSLAEKAPDHQRFNDYPTAATTVLRFDVDNWADMALGTGQIEIFATPHDLDF